MSKHVTDRLMPYAEGLLASPAATAVATHVLQCLPCRRALDQIRRNLRALKTLRAVDVPDPVAATLQWSDLEPRLGAPTSPSRNAHAGWALAVAAAVLLATGSVLAGRGDSEKAPVNISTAGRAWLDLEPATAPPETSCLTCHPRTVL